jgi:Flp pilus assembly protein TadB
MTAALGSFAAGVALFIAMVASIEPRFSRHWIRCRLQPPNTSRHKHGDTSLEPIELAIFLDAIARTMQSGSSLGHALINEADAHPALTPFTEPIVVRCMRGLDVASAIDDIDSSSWTTDARHTARSLALASINNSSQIIQHGAAIIRERIALTEESNTRSEQAKASLKILTRSPLIVLALIVAMSADARLYLFTTIAGLCCVAFGISLQIVGRRWMSALVAETMP